jgi:GTPase SAR1 family protein
MRRGLGTTETDKADRLVAELNAILSDSSWWSAIKRVEAERKFSKVIVDAFYDDIQTGRPDPWAVREGHIALPTADEGYSRIMFVGTTGAGKTSLLRHVIGSDPDEDRFPSTSTAKTTVSDIEVILAEGGYSGVVTFFSEFWVQANVEECIADACAAVWEGAPVAKIADRFLNHRDQRFRLNYSLGSWGGENDAVVEDDWAFDDVSVEPTVSEDSGLDDAERQSNVRALRAYIDRLGAISERVIVLISKELDEDVLKLSGPDREAAQELFEERLQDDADFDVLVQDVMDDVRKRFDFLTEGELTIHNSGWPATWTIECDDRSQFIEQIRWFSSNYAPQFGRLLTPIVDGIRVRGPLFPTFTTLQPKLVLLDGQGLGHTPDSSASVTTQITRRFADVDVILLVDSAQQPMQAAPLSVIRSVAVSGNHQKLAIAFTHFDQVKGINLPTFAAKRAHVMASVTNGLSNLKDVLGVPIVRAIERIIEDHCFMLGALDQPSKKLPNGVKTELERMFDFFERAIAPTPEPEAHPVYNPDGLVLALQGAARAFRRPWAARLGLGAHESAHKEHWGRIKALNRRIAGEFDPPEYDTLKPVADLLARLSEEVSRFLDNPSGWEPRIPDEEEAELALADIRQQVYADLHLLAERRLVEDHLDAWRAAYEYRGKGSTFERAQEINAIYESGAPIASTVITAVSAEFIQEMRQLVHQAIIAHGGKLVA